MNKAQKFLLENNLDDIVLNAKHSPWIYLSDVLEQYLAHTKDLPVIAGQSEQLKAFAEMVAKDDFAYLKDAETLLKDFESL